MAQTIHWRFGFRTVTLARPRRWFCLAIFLGLVYWLCIRPKKYTEIFELHLEESDQFSLDSKHLWEFVADFSNHPKLNPTITRFEILYEKGNYENWEYGVDFQQNSLLLPHWIQYQNHAIFKILPEVKESFKHINAANAAKIPTNPSFNIHEPAKILSNQTSCYLGYCMDSVSEMRFITIHTAKMPPKSNAAGRVLIHDKPIADSKSTRILETLYFQCPPILTYLFAVDLYMHKKLVYENIQNSIDLFL